MDDYGRRMDDRTNDKRIQMIENNGIMKPKSHIDWIILWKKRPLYIYWNC